MRLIHPRNVKRSLIAIAGALIISGAVFFGRVLAANVTASWSYDYGPMPGCSERLTTSCIDHFEVLDISDREKEVVIRFVGNPKPAVGKVSKISTDFKYGPPFGQRTISVIAVGRGPNGGRVTSDPDAARVTVSISPSARMSLAF
jgi:hypothetical protein